MSKFTIEQYNYDSFVPEKFKPLMRFDESPDLGRPAPDFPLAALDDGSETTLAAQWTGKSLLVVEFGSFT